MLLKVLSKVSNFLIEDEKRLSNKTKLWEHEYNKRGTCVQSLFNQHSFFQTALKFRYKLDLLNILTQKGIKPNGEFYGLDEVKSVTGFAPGNECNEDVEGNKQLFQFYVCLDNYAKEFVECPYVPDVSCAPKIKFPKFPKTDSLSETLSMINYLDNK